MVKSAGIQIWHHFPSLPQLPWVTLGKAGNVFLPLVPNGNLNQSLINPGAFSLQAIGGALFAQGSSGLQPISALALGYVLQK